MGRAPGWPETLLSTDALGDSPFPGPRVQPLACQIWGAGLHRQQLQLGTYPQSKLPFASLPFTFALITGWGKSPRQAKNLGDLLQSPFLSF